MWEGDSDVEWERKRARERIANVSHRGRVFSTSNHLQLRLIPSFLFLPQWILSLSLSAQKSLLRCVCVWGKEGETLFLSLPWTHPFTPPILSLCLSTTWLYHAKLSEKVAVTMAPCTWSREKSRQGVWQWLCVGLHCYMGTIHSCFLRRIFPGNTVSLASPYHERQTLQGLWRIQLRWKSIIWQVNYICVMSFVNEQIRKLRYMM